MVFAPRKSNQDYCGKRCRRRALRVRTKAAKLSEVLTLQPPLALAVAVRRLNQARRAAGLPPAERSPYLQAHCELIEAQAQLKRWQDLVRERAQKLAQMPQPDLRARLLKVEPGQSVQLDPAASHYGAAATDSGLGIVGLGFQSEAVGPRT